MTDAETIQRLLLQDTLQKEELGKRDAELAKTLDRTDDMRKKIKRQRLKNGRLNQTIFLKHLCIGYCKRRRRLFVKDIIP
jgi:hypothetical protein